MTRNAGDGMWHTKIKIGSKYSIKWKKYGMKWWEMKYKRKPSFEGTITKTYAETKADDFAWVNNDGSGFHNQNKWQHTTPFINL